MLILLALGSSATEWESPFVVALKLAVILFLVLLNGFFVASEFAIVKVRASQLEALADSGEKRAKFARHVTSHLDAYLSATQLGITLASLALGFLGEEYLAAIIQPVFFHLGITSQAVIHSVSIALAFITITFLHIVLGELAPKSLAIRRPVPTTLWASRPLDWFYVIFRPAISLLNGAANWLLRHLLGIEPAGEHELAHSEEELRLILSESQKAEEITGLEKQMLLNVFELRNRVARDIMTPRLAMVFLRVEDSFAENLQRAKQSGHSRFPLCEGDADHPVGLIHLKDLVMLMDDPSRDLAAVKRPLIHVPEMMGLPRLLTMLLSQHVHFTVVVDEYGGIVGIVTLENVLEELVGEIKGEFEVVPPEFKRLNEVEFNVKGGLGLYELRDLAGLDLEHADVSTVGGYITSQLGHLPKQGEQLTIGNYLVTITEADGRRVQKAHFKQIAGETGGDTEHG